MFFPFILVLLHVFLWTRCHVLFWPTPLNSKPCSQAQHILTLGHSKYPVTVTWSNMIVSSPWVLAVWGYACDVRCVYGVIVCPHTLIAQITMVRIGLVCEMDDFTQWLYSSQDALLTGSFTASLSPQHEHIHVTLIVMNTLMRIIHISVCMYFIGGLVLQTHTSNKHTEPEVLIKDDDDDDDDDDGKPCRSTAVVLLLFPEPSRTTRTQIVKMTVFFRSHTFILYSL